MAEWTRSGGNDVDYSKMTKRKSKGAYMLSRFAGVSEAGAAIREPNFRLSFRADRGPHRARFWLGWGGGAREPVTKRKSKGAYMISAVAEMYDIHPQTLRLYEREGLLKPSRTEGNTRLYTDEDLQRLEFILSLARDLGVNISGIAIILQMRERMEEMQRQIQEFVQYIQQEVLTRANAAADPSKGAIIPVRRPIVAVQPAKKR